jgi:hypothetical protein
VVLNGTNDIGGGIIYDDFNTGALKDPPDGTCPVSTVITNNIIAYSEKAGLRTGGEGYPCPATPVHDYNLLYANYPWNDIFNRDNDADCGWFEDGGVAYATDMSCTQQQYGGCGAHFESGGPSPIVLDGPHDIMADPKFQDMDADNYQLQGISPAKNAGDDGNDMGAYGGSDPMVDSQIPDF